MSKGEQSFHFFSSNYNNSEDKPINTGSYYFLIMFNINKSVKTKKQKKLKV